MQTGFHVADLKAGILTDRQLDVHGLDRYRTKMLRLVLFEDIPKKWWLSIILSIILRERDWQFWSILRYPPFSDPNINLLMIIPVSCRKSQGPSPHFPTDLHPWKSGKKRLHGWLLNRRRLNPDMTDKELETMHKSMDKDLDGKARKGIETCWLIGGLEHEF